MLILKIYSKLFVFKPSSSLYAHHYSQLHLHFSGNVVIGDEDYLDIINQFI